MWTCVAWAHPRSRGENESILEACLEAVGSSPLTRGKLADTLDKETGAGLIPAHAGKTMVARVRRGGWRAHPRSRGENAHLRVNIPC